MKASISILICLLSISLIGQDWTFQKEVEGIKAYNRPVNKSKFKEYKIEAEIVGSLESIVAVLQDIDIYLDIFPDNKKATIISTSGETHFEIFLHTKTPFPVKDRFTYTHTDYTYDASSSTVSLSINCVDNEYLRSQKKRGVLVTECKGSWEITDLKNGKLGIVHQFYANPGGMVPAWIVNKRTIDSPIKSIKTIRKFVKQKEYQDRAFEFINR